MKIRVATYNLENLFTRPAAMAADAGKAGQQAIDDHAAVNALIARPAYSDADQARLLELERTYGFADLNAPANALIVLNKVRGQLYSKSRAGVVSVKARSRGDWTGWFELRRTDIRWQATLNTARVIAEVRPDVLICVEAENRPTLLRFNDQVLGAEFQRAFDHVMVIDGNDDRGIDVGLLSRFPLDGMRSHVDDRNPNGERTFSRDCPEYVVALQNGQRLAILPNHFKSKRGGNDHRARARRLAQAVRAAELASAARQITDLVLLGGDLNDTPDSTELAPLWHDGFKDVQSHPSYPTDRPGTFDTGTARNKIDYLIMSPVLHNHLQATGIERRGSYHPNTWVPFDTVRSKADEASDHHLVWADFAF